MGTSSAPGACSSHWAKAAWAASAWPSGPTAPTSSRPHSTGALGLQPPCGRGASRARRQILAGLDHPQIARLLDGGQTAEGWPFPLSWSSWTASASTPGASGGSSASPARVALMQNLCEGPGLRAPQPRDPLRLKPRRCWSTATGACACWTSGVAPGGRPGRTTAGLTPRLCQPRNALAGRAPTTASDVTAWKLPTGRAVPPWPVPPARLQAIVS